MAGLIILLFFASLAITAPWIAPYRPTQPVADATCSTLPVPATYLQPPCPAHPLGTNYFSNDIYSQVIWGTQISFIVGFASAFVATVVGTGMGLISGYVGGWIDEVLMRFNDVVLSIPWLVLMIVVAAKVRVVDLTVLILVVALTRWSVTALAIRSKVLSIQALMSVDRAYMLGVMSP